MECVDECLVSWFAIYFFFTLSDRALWLHSTLFFISLYVRGYDKVQVLRLGLIHKSWAKLLKIGAIGKLSGYFPRV